jgi:hypothetical protein
MRLSTPLREVIEIMSRNPVRAATGTHAYRVGPDLIQESHNLPEQLMNTLNFCMQEVYMYWAILRVARPRRRLGGATLRYDSWMSGRGLAYPGSTWAGCIPYKIQPHDPRGWRDPLGTGR